MLGFNDAITPRTRVMFFSHITTFSGVVLPAKELAALSVSTAQSLIANQGAGTGIRRLVSV